MGVNSLLKIVVNMNFQKLICDDFYNFEFRFWMNLFMQILNFEF